MWGGSVHLAHPMLTTNLIIVCPHFLAVSLLCKFLHAVYSYAVFDGFFEKCGKMLLVVTLVLHSCSDTLGSVGIMLFCMPIVISILDKAALGRHGSFLCARQPYRRHVPYM